MRPAAGWEGDGRGGKEKTQRVRYSSLWGLLTGLFPGALLAKVTTEDSLLERGQGKNDTEDRVKLSG